MKNQLLPILCLLAGAIYVPIAQAHPHADSIAHTDWDRERCEEVSVILPVGGMGAIYHEWKMSDVRGYVTCVHVVDLGHPMYAAYWDWAESYHWPEDLGFSPDPISLSVNLPNSPLISTPGDVQPSSVPSGDAAAALGIQAAGYAPMESAQQITPTAENGSAAALGLAALPVALLAGWHILSPDEWSAPSFGFSGVLTDSSSDAVGSLSVQRGSLSAYADAHLSRGATTEYVGGAEYRAARWLSFTYAAHAREGKSDADLVFGAVADRRVGRWLFTAGADTEAGARAQAVLSLGR